MTDRSSPIATLERWLHDQTGANRDAVRQLFLDCGYSEEQAADYRSVWLYYRDGWPRLTLMAANPDVPVGYLQRIANKLLPLLRAEHTP